MKKVVLACALVVLVLTAIKVFSSCDGSKKVPT